MKNKKLACTITLLVLDPSFLLEWRCLIWRTQRNHLETMRTRHTLRIWQRKDQDSGTWMIEWQEQCFPRCGEGMGSFEVEFMQICIIKHWIMHTKIQSLLLSFFLVRMTGLLNAQIDQMNYCYHLQSRGNAKVQFSQVRMKEDRIVLIIWKNM